jgi:hypothetical protein
MSEYPMRERDEIQRAHDMLTAVALDDELRQRLIEPGRLVLVKASLDTLCWVLRHDHNHTFAMNLELLEMKLKLMGIEIKRFDTMQFPGVNGEK